MKFIKRPQSEQERYVHAYADKILGHKDAGKMKRLDEWCLQKLKHGGRPCSFRQVVEMPYEGLLKIKGQLDQIPKEGQLPNDLADYAKSLYGCISRMDFIDTLGETVCPYCNRMYINRSSDHTVCQLDHFFSKGSYPILAVSFYNLVPCCAICNLIKHRHKLGYSPYDRSVESADQLLEFDYKATNYAQMSGAEPPSEIKIKYLNPIIKKNIKTLELDQLYQIHTREAQELILKRKIYGARYAEYLNEHYKDIGMSVEQFAAGSYTDPDEYGRQPLSKLKTDISRKLNLI